MAEVSDIKVDSTNDLQIVDGDFVIGLSDEQHVGHIILANQGEWKATPLIGVGIQGFLNAPFTLAANNEIVRAIKLHLELDDYNVVKIDVSQLPALKVDAQRK